MRISAGPGYGLIILLSLFCTLNVSATDLSDTLKVKSIRQLAKKASSQGKSDSCVVYLQLEKDLCYALATAYDHPARWADYVNSLAALGDQYRVRSEFEKAENVLNRALSVGREKLGNVHYENSNTLNNLGIYYKNLQDYPKALECFQQSFDIFVQVKGPEHRIVGHLYNNLGVISKNLHEYERSVGYYQNALVKFKDGYGKDYHRIGMVYRNLGLSYLEMNEYVQAVSYIQKSLDFYTTINTQRVLDKIHSIVCLGRAYHEMGKLDSAQTFYEQAMALNSSLENPYVAETQNLCKKLGRIYLTKNDLAKADSLFQQAHALCLQIWGEGIELANVLCEMSELARAKGDYYAALDHVEQAIDVLIPDHASLSLRKALDSSLYDPSLLQCLTLKAQILEEIYERERISLRDLEQSFETWHMAVDLLDKMREKLDDNSRLFLNQNLGDRIYRQAVRVALYLHELDPSPNLLQTAFYWSEKAKANVLYGLMNESRARSFAGIPDSLLHRERSLKSRIAYWERQRFEGDQERNEAERHIFRLKSRQAELIRQFESHYPEYYQLKYQTDPVSVQRIQSGLTESAVLVSYFFTDKDLVAFIITQDDMQAIPLHVDSTIHDQIHEYCRAIRMMDQQNVRALGGSLGRQLLSPVSSQVKAAKLILIPHDALYRLPFDALLLSQNKNSTRFSDLDYLIRHAATSYHYSASLYALVNRKTQPFSASFAGFAPVFSDHPPSRWIADVWGIGHPAITRDSKTLQALPHSDTEIAAIAEQMALGQIPGKCFTETQATESAFKAVSPEYSMIHLASHGLIDHEHPQCSAIAFFPEDTTDADQDGMLYAGEIYNLQLNADLVVLSCCESGTGKLVKGEGLAALTRGFLYAGANNLLVSLWKIPDKSTSRFMPGFYRRLVEGADYAHALRAMKLEYIDRESTAFPYYWSGFILIGR
ncbi:CHAT domain-containing protein [candidate division KSB1 bacterium]|nr:CHAT domain-containing protein [candidate division KSB1 bacterium]